MNLWTVGAGVAADNYWNELGNTHKYLCVCVLGLCISELKEYQKCTKKYKILNIRHYQIVREELRFCWLKFK